MIFTYDQLEELGVYAGNKNIFTEDIDEGRWYKYYCLVFKYENKSYMVNYQEGLTEMQDLYREDHFLDMSNGQVECPEVELYTETVEVTKWKLV